MSKIKNSVGHIYILKNDVYNYYGDNVYKIGKALNVKNRLGDYSTFYVDKCKVLYESDPVIDYNLCESIIFRIIDDKRVIKNREFFKGDIHEFKIIIDKVVGAINNKLINDGHKETDTKLLAALCDAINCTSKNTIQLDSMTNDVVVASKKKKTVCKPIQLYTVKHKKTGVEYTCNKCQKVFNKKSTCDYHVNKKIPCDGSHKICEFCNEEYSSTKYLKKHLLICKFKQ
jgi:hypothetical protein